MHYFKLVFINNKKNYLVNLFKFSNILTVGLIALLFTSCGKDPITKDASVTLQNTLEKPGLPGFETEANFGDPVTKTVSDEVEFATFVGIYDVDVDDSSITFSMSDAAKTNEEIVALFRTIEEGTFDRYYFTFDEAQNFESVETDNSNVTASVVSDKELKVEVGPGFVFGEDSRFIVTLKK